MKPHAHQLASATRIGLDIIDTQQVVTVSIRDKGYLLILRSTFFFMATSTIRTKYLQLHNDSDSVDDLKDKNRAASRIE